MAVASPSSPSLVDRRPESDKPEFDNPSNPLPPVAPPENPNPNANPNINPAPPVIAPPPPAVPTFIPSFRPLVPPAAPQYSAVPNPAYQLAVQPPGVAPPGSMVAAPPLYPGQPPTAIPRPPYAPLPPNGYMPVPPPGQVHAAVIPPPGIPRYPAPYPTMMRPGFPMRPPTALIPPLSRPPMPGIRVPPVIAPAVRPPVPIVQPTEKPQTTVYVGKISPSVDNEFLLSLLRLCGPVKSWKRAQDPSDGTPKGFGFCEFESAEGVLRALRLLSKLNIDGQELVLNINQATREYLERYVEKKTEREKLKAAEGETEEKENEVASGVAKQEPPKLVVEETKKDAEDSGDENQDNAQKFGIVTDEDRDMDKDALEKITDMVEERLKTKPLPPPPPVQTPADGSGKSNSEAPSRSRDGDSDVDIMKTDVAEDKIDDETSSEIKPATERDKHETSSPDRSRRHDRRSRDMDREYELKREKERELERYERERERERVRRERERELRMREAERMYKERVKEWEAREREKEYQRQKDKDREKGKERERWREISKQEDESDDDEARKRRRRSSAYEEKRRKRQREKEEDLADRFKEEQEIAEAKKKATKEQPQVDYSQPLSGQVTNGNEKAVLQGCIENAVDKVVEADSGNGNNADDENHRNGGSDVQTLGSAAGTDVKQNGSAPTRKLGFGLIGSGKRTAVPSVFHEEDDEDVEEKKMRPLVPLDYSTEELQAVQTTVSGAQPNLVAAAEFAKRISSANPKEEKPDLEKERSKRPSERSSQRERDRNYDENTRTRDESKEKMHDKISDREKDREDKPKAENRKLLDAKQLIDRIPKTKEELFAYEINWDIYDKHKLHERMRPWIAKKINEYLGEEEETLVEYIVTSTKDHVEASRMLELLQSILDDEAEMFVLKMWRMLIFEIKKVESGLSAKPRA